MSGRYCVFCVSGRNSRRVCRGKRRERGPGYVELNLIALLFRIVPIASGALHCPRSVKTQTARPRQKVLIRTRHTNQQTDFSRQMAMLVYGMFYESFSFAVKHITLISLTFRSCVYLKYLTNDNIVEHNCSRHI